MSGAIDDPGSLASRVSGLTAALAERDAMIAGFRATVAARSVRIAELERRLGLDSSSSGKPPPGDGLAKPTAKV